MNPWVTLTFFDYCAVQTSNPLVTDVLFENTALALTYSLSQHQKSILQHVIFI